MTKDELQFLPATLEIQETPPSPIGRAILWTLMAFFVIAAVWAWVGETDIVAVAHGKIIPAGHSKVIQPLEIGTVRQIHVTDGQAVHAGDLLIELDPTTQEADAERLRAEWMTAQAGRARIQALLGAIDNDAPTAEAYYVTPDEVDAAITRVQLDLMRNQLQEHRARDVSLNAEIRRQTAEQAGIQDNIHKLERVIPLVSERAASLKTLSNKRMAAKNDYLMLEQERIEHVQDLAALKSRRRETEEAIAQTRAQRDSLKAEFRSSLYTEQADFEARIAALTQELIKARTRTGLQQLRAPVDGVVQQLAVHTVGGVVTPAQALMVIVPNEQVLEVEAFIENKDIGFVAEGQSAEVKVDAFPFTKYGTIDGEITNVSNDAVENEQLGWAFTSRVAMNAHNIAVGEKLVNLTPGMSVTVEVKTGKRRVIEFLISPLLRYKEESARER